MTAPTVDELSGNSAFQGLLSLILGFASAYSTELRGKTVEELEARQADAEDLYARLNARLKEHSEPSEEELDRLAQLAGIPVATIRTSTT
jgi:hypothetical protein